MNSPAPQVVLISRNLFGTSRISGVVRGNGLQISVVRDLQQLREVASDQLIAVLADLDEPVNLETVGEELADSVERIAYGPHVDTAKLKAASAAGWQVLTRGQFDVDLPTLAQKWAGQ